MKPTLSGLLLVLCMLLSSCVRVPVTNVEKEVFAPLSVMTSYGITIPGDYFKYEKYQKKIFYDNTFMLEYEYSAPRDKHKAFLYLDQAFLFKRSISDVSIDALTQQWLSTNADFTTYHMKLLEKPNLFSWGEKSKLYDIVDVNNQAIGNYFVASYRNMMFTFINVGFSIEQGDVWNQLLRDRLDKSKEFRIGFYSLGRN